MVHVSVPILVAAVAIGIAPAMAAPVSFEGEHEISSRDFELETRNPPPVFFQRCIRKGIQVLEDRSHAKLTAILKGVVADFCTRVEPDSTPTQFSAKFSAAVEMMTHKHDPTIVKIVTGGGSIHKRDSEELEARELDELDA